MVPLFADLLRKCGVAFFELGDLTPQVKNFLYVGVLEPIELVSHVCASQELLVVHSQMSELRLRPVQLLLQLLFFNLVKMFNVLDHGFEAGFYLLVVRVRRVIFWAHWLGTVIFH